MQLFDTESVYWGTGVNAQDSKKESDPASTISIGKQIILYSVKGRIGFFTVPATIIRHRIKW